MSGESLGRVSVGDRVISARLNTTIAEQLTAATTDDKRLEATLDDVLEASQASQSGGMPKRRGSFTEERKDVDGDEAMAMAEAESAKKSKTQRSLTREAIREMIQSLDGLVGQVDRAAATMVGLLPTAVRSVAVSAGVGFAINNPTIFAQITRVVTGAADATIRAGTQAGWSVYADAIRDIAGQMGDLAGTIGEVGLDSPWFAVTSALLIMRYRANQQGVTVSRLLTDDARRVTEVATALGAGAGAAAGNALTQAAEVVWATVANAYADAQVAPLREIAERARTSGPAGAGADEMREAVRGVGAPAAESGPGGSITLVPSLPPRDLRTALDALTRIPAPRAEVAAATALGAGAGDPTPLPAPRGEPTFRSPSPPKGKKGGKRKTKKTKRKTYRSTKKTRGKTKRFVY